MPTASAVIEIPASADKVWELVGGFNDLPKWLPLIVRASLARVAACVTCKPLTVAWWLSVLQTFDNVGRTYSYTIEASPFPVSAYLATLQVEALTDSSAKVTWSGVFTPVAGVTDEAVEELFAGVYSGGVAALRANF